MWIGLAAGTALMILSLYLRWRMEVSTPNEGPDLIWTDFLFLFGGGVAARSSVRMLGEDLDSPAMVLAMGIAFLTAGVLMRRRGCRFGWGWPWLLAQNSTRTGRAVFLFGLMFALGSVVLFLSPPGVA